MGPKVSEEVGRLDPTKGELVDLVSSRSRSLVGYDRADWSRPGRVAGISSRHAWRSSLSSRRSSFLANLCSSKDIQTSLARSSLIL
jgi:hypothetical protein